ncbi:hypothetical protein [Thalassobacillus sp. CUG 92003]|uniref:hypothetical protein n=1 Tax=Thalassobacillus sp. CUG 92003 TaxID=2736641 RepID=UPI0015E68A04|nr:hypothetical protein [Thalassobacillus sp. CUG 92003]
MSEETLRDKNLIKKNIESLSLLLQEKGLSNEIEDELIQDMLTVLIKTYAIKVKLKGNTLLPITPEKLDQTETTIFVDQLLKSMDIELFEMQIWRSIGSNY